FLSGLLQRPTCWRVRRRFGGGGKAYRRVEVRGAFLERAHGAMYQLLEGFRTSFPRLLRFLEIDEHRHPKSGSLQCINYLKASGLRVALLINFQKPKVAWKRILLDS